MNMFSHVFCSSYSLLVWGVPVLFIPLHLHPSLSHASSNCFYLYWKILAMLCFLCISHCFVFLLQFFFLTSLSPCYNNITLKLRISTSLCLGSLYLYTLLFMPHCFELVACVLGTPSLRGLFNASILLHHGAIVAGKWFYSDEKQQINNKHKTQLIAYNTNEDSNIHSIR